MTFILTRYLYEKTKVEESLFLSLNEKNISESMFWAYELFYSGFEDIVFQILERIQKTFLFKTPKSFLKFYEKQMNLWRTTQNNVVPANIIYNAISHTQQQVVETIDPNNQEKHYRKSITYVLFGETHIYKYSNYENRIPEYKAYKVLREGCLYPIRSCVDPTFIEEIEFCKKIENYHNHWLYYASFSPIWKNRIEKYGGTICDEKKLVDFSDEDLEELFYSKFGYEPDEQPLEIQEKNMGKILLINVL